MKSFALVFGSRDPFFGFMNIKPMKQTRFFVSTLTISDWTLQWFRVNFHLVFAGVFWSPKIAQF